MKTVKIKIILEDGRIMDAELYPQLAPLSVENFVNLVKQKYYDGLIFHRVIKGFMIQGGGFNIEMQEKEDLQPIKGEFSSNGWKDNLKLKHEQGVLSMARTNDPNSATSQFFIVTGEAGFLDGQYATFGKLIGQKSLEVARQIENVETISIDFYDDVPKTPVIIKTIELLY
ncbi:peptidylprolyl isomerase [Spiroplasma tabanidicola]|uniref:Peptidyl-prolyl cis-trans isomerase n=1 Tax=Spiroplasma tabanidicola TaxID=324079 RepID=A0A6I6CBQ2_9MOLU|nr:peptidylprolyl isomerase [Spiroplasma tabanidicola]QGS51404.1 peptidyl-prolyl cis-trans isomerase [Spiroplasma tabanidicola]